MPDLLIPKPLYPLVPNAPGVPALLRNGAQLLDTATLGYLGVSDALDELIGAEPAKWGVYGVKGGKIAAYDSVGSVSYQNDSRVSDYPIEKGAFASYNKVESPFEIVVTLHCGGTEAARSKFQTDIEAARRSLDRFTVLTPDRTYYDVNFTGVNWQRSIKEGAHMIIAQLIGREIREISTAAYSASKDVGAFDPKAQGQIQILNDPTIDTSGLA